MHAWAGMNAYLDGRSFPLWCEIVNILWIDVFVSFGRTHILLQ